MLNQLNYNRVKVINWDMNCGQGWTFEIIFKDNHILGDSVFGNLYRERDFFEAYNHFLNDWGMFAYEEETMRFFNKR